ncbi:TatD family hydrolase [Prosthecochloris vibrioformis]|uniref:TatD family deoxyribonuclease n=1 Tax=Prosthecochloris vibrioformis TaxID=1098 RepID=A0A5C4S4B7_PROVB|nr:TatD family hydrolase [Prosthecochloris vibrioformis]TNJ38068.1 TatD family deoxyribonuclease [Prosthecochloris vibrioformis]
MFIDVHAHLSFPEFDEDRSEVIGRMFDAGVTALIDPGTNLETSRRSIELSRQHNFIHACVGLHPHDLQEKADPALFDALGVLVKDPEVVAVGEVGLDYHYPGYDQNAQEDAFRTMLRLAVEHDKPLVIHARDAWQDTLRILREEHSSGLRGIMHCFSGDIDTANACIALGFSISIPGTITFKKSTLPSVVREIGMEHLLSETDSPYLAPTPYRGKRNEPAYVGLVTAAIAEAKQLPLDTTAAMIMQNARQLFALKSPPTSLS